MEFWELTVRFFSLVDANVRYVVAGSMLLGAAAGGLGSFVYLQKRSLLGDALSHAALPGVALAFLVVGRKEFLALVIGAAVTAWLGSLSVNAIVRKTKLKLDAALGIVLSVFFGIGIVLLTHIQKTGSGTQAGLDKFLFGQAAAMGKGDVMILAIVALCLLIVVTIGYNRFKIISFDYGFAASMGMRVGWLEFLLTTMIVFAVTIGLQAVGVVLMAAMLITPAAAARQWTDRLWLMIIIAAFFGIISGLMGAYISFLAPRFPTGPWMVVVVSTIFGLSLLFVPRRGLVSVMLRRRKARRKMTDENLLKALFKTGQQRGELSSYYPVSEILQMWSFGKKEMAMSLGRLSDRGLLQRQAEMFRMTNEGVAAGARITRLHRLWEVYLSRFLELPGDHVHRDAEDMEHIITPEMEQQLDKLLGHPAHDPHHREIPYANGVTEQVDES